MSEGNFIGGQAYEPLRRLLSDSKIQAMQAEIRIKSSIKETNWSEETVHLDELDVSDIKSKVLIAIDGDYSKSIIENGYPGAEIGYITVSTVAILLNKVRELEKEEFIDPKKFRETEKTSSIDSLFVGCNVVLQGEQSATSSMRKILYKELYKCHIFKDSESLLDTYHTLLRERPKGGRAPKCPYDECEADYEFSEGEYLCKSCGGKLYSTDALRLHELLNNSGTSGEMYGQIKETFKKLQLIHILRTFEQHPKYFSLLREMVFFMEGPLAVFSTASWLARPIRKELERVNDKVRAEFGADLIILGIERTGNFVKHFMDIDTKKDGTDNNFPNQSAFLLTNSYIKEHIVYNENPHFVYLNDTSFGRKFFYKTKGGYRVVSSVATFSNYQSNTDTAFPAQFPRLSDVLVLLDKLVSSRYENSITPLAAAHAEAAIPLNLGKSVFEDIARQIKEQSNAS
ncbi:DNA double-strand break repair nuclease NurA [Dinghuibacter silviterrae]|uniref:NurA domain-containing protein n=1 Tax=Dinghuibacter silviterrae TaxID=1539049 RepID=A0A4R8DEI2_9BACT|nr:DNA double-strand break repair nuclease NurA [Dinghuibacter silviterrae]TDW95941.1 NurA domain-containing protein [Dinghuibacter silviterrae]